LRFAQKAQKKFSIVPIYNLRGAKVSRINVETNNGYQEKESCNQEEGYQEENFEEEIRSLLG